MSVQNQKGERDKGGLLGKTRARKSARKQIGYIIHTRTRINQTQINEIKQSKNTSSIHPRYILERIFRYSSSANIHEFSFFLRRSLKVKTRIFIIIDTILLPKRNHRATYKTRFLTKRFVHQHFFRSISFLHIFLTYHYSV